MCMCEGDKESVSVSERCVMVGSRSKAVAVVQGSENKGSSNGRQLCALDSGSEEDEVVEGRVEIRKDKIIFLFVVGRGAKRQCLSCQRGDSADSQIYQSM